MYPRRVLVLTVVRAGMLLALAGGALVPAAAQEAPPTPPPAPGTEKLRLKDITLVGDRCTVDSLFQMDLDLKVQGGPMQGQQGKISSRQHTKMVRKVLGVDAKGAVNAQRVAYLIARARVALPTGQVKESPLPLQGRVFTVKRTGAKTTVTVDKGKVTPQQRAAMAGAMKVGDVAIFPDREVGPGDEWTLSEAKIQQLLDLSGTPVKKLEARCRFAEVTTFANRRCARIAMTLNADVAPAPMFTVSMNLTGDLYYALDIERPIQMEITGPVTMGGSAAPAAGIAVSGEGTANGKTTFEWMELGGKPVSKPAPGEAPAPGGAPPTTPPGALEK